MHRSPSSTARKPVAERDTDDGRAVTRLIYSRSIGAIPVCPAREKAR